VETTFEILPALQVQAKFGHRAMLWALGIVDLDLSSRPDAFSGVEFRNGPPPLFVLGKTSTVFIVMHINLLILEALFSSGFDPHLISRYLCLSARKLDLQHAGHSFQTILSHKRSIDECRIFSLVLPNL